MLLLEHLDQERYFKRTGFGFGSRLVLASRGRFINRPTQSYINRKFRLVPYVKQNYSATVTGLV